MFNINFAEYVETMSGSLWMASVPVMAAGTAENCVTVV